MTRWAFGRQGFVPKEIHIDMTEGALELKMPLFNGLLVFDRVVHHRTSKAWNTSAPPCIRKVPMCR